MSGFRKRGKQSSRIYLHCQTWHGAVQIIIKKVRSSIDKWMQLLLRYTVEYTNLFYHFTIAFFFCVNAKCFKYIIMSIMSIDPSKSIMNHLNDNLSSPKIICKTKSQLISGSSSIKHAIQDMLTWHWSRRQEMQHWCSLITSIRDVNKCWCLFVYLNWHLTFYSAYFYYRVIFFIIDQIEIMWSLVFIFILNHINI